MITSIVVLNYNDWKTTEQFVIKAKEFDSLDYIVIVDNNSSDNSVEKLHYLEDTHTILIRNDTNNGYAAGNNVGARFSVDELNADIVFISNPDIECTDEDIKRIKNVFLEKKDAAVVTGLIHNFDSKGNPHIFSSFGWKVPTYGDMLSNCFLVIYKFRRSIVENSNYYPMKYATSSDLIEVEAVPGCFFAISSELLKAINYFDEDTFLYYEETILGYQIKEQKRKVYIAPQAKIYHCENINKNRTIKQRIKTDKRTLNSALVYIRKYLNRKGFWEILYKGCFWLGIAERRIICGILKR